MYDMDASVIPGRILLVGVNGVLPYQYAVATDVQVQDGKTPPASACNVY